MRGFTLIELLITIAILALVSTLAAPFLLSSTVSTDVDAQAQTIKATLRRAAQQARAGQHGDGWGVYFNTAGREVILFKGTSYAGRDSNFDITDTYPADVTVSTDFNDEIIFSSFSAAPSASGTVQISSENNDQKFIFINGYGKVE